MIIYESNHPIEVLRLEGSNIPRAALFAMPSVTINIAAYVLLYEFPEYLGWLQKVNLSQLWSATVIVVGLLLAMRTNKAYDRFWEGITLVQLVRAEWFEAASNLIAFSLVSVKTNPGDEKAEKACNDFQYILVRLMSLMHGAALRQIGGHQEDFQVLDVKAIDADSLAYLARCEEEEVNPVEVLLQWVQVLVTDCVTSGVLAVPAPILTRCFQTLSRGMVNLHDCRKLAECPFPFPLTQMVYVLLFVQSLLTPIFIAASVKHPVIAVVMTFVPIFGMFAITFTAGELEHPFGNDPNDLPLSRLQKDYNKSLLMLLDRQTFHAPHLVTGSAQNVDTLRLKYSKSRLSSMTNCIGTESIDLRSFFGEGSEGSDDEDEENSVEDEPAVDFLEDHVRIVLPHEDDSNDSDRTEEHPKVMVHSPSPEYVQKAMARSPNPEFVQSLAEECVGALTTVLTKLWHHRPYADSASNVEVFANGIWREEDTRDKEKESLLHELTVPSQHTASQARRVVALGEETCPNHPVDISGFGLMPACQTPRMQKPEPIPPGQHLHGDSLSTRESPRLDRLPQGSAGQSEYFIF